jgi:type VI secretion system protein ImpC
MRPKPETPFRILVLGDFGGRPSRGAVSPVARTSKHGPVLVDRDTLDRVLKSMAVELHLALPVGGRLAIQVREMDDFHPDSIYERHEAFQALRQLRRKLGEPAGFAEAAAEIRGWTAAPERPGRPAPARDQDAVRPPESASGVLEQILQREEETSGGAPARVADDLQSFVRRIVAPYLVPGEDPRQAELIATVDAAAGDLMRSILHQREFQAVEAAWRALAMLVHGLEDGQLSLSIVDLTKAELAADLAADDDLERTGLYRLLVEEAVGTPGVAPWAVIAGNYTFESTAEDVQTLRRLAWIASRAGAPVLGAASPRIVGCASLVETLDPREWDREAPNQHWQALRRSPEASYLGLALPRFLLRLPYGEDTDRTERFSFEEMPGAPAHEDYLWANPAFACVYLLAQTFSREGWALRPGRFREITGLPLHVRGDGERRITPCAEVLLTERAAEAMLDQGLMPLASMKDRDAVQLVRFQSVAAPLRALSGWWGSSDR